MNTISAHFQETATPANFMGKGVPAGWSLTWVNYLGTNVGQVEDASASYATREEAEARIPALLAARDARIAEEELAYGSSDDFFSRDADNDSTGGLWR